MSRRQKMKRRQQAVGQANSRAAGVVVGEAEKGPEQQPGPNTDAGDVVVNGSAEQPGDGFGSYLRQAILSGARSGMSAEAVSECDDEFGLETGKENEDGWGWNPELREALDLRSGSRERAGEIAEDCPGDDRHVGNLPHVDAGFDGNQALTDIKCADDSGSQCVATNQDNSGWNLKLQALAPQPSALGHSQFQSFPVDCLPQAVREFVVGYARALDCDPSHLAVPALAVLASSIGNTRIIRLSEFWTEPSILWTAVVGDSGTRKTPPIFAAVKPMRDGQDFQFQSYAERMLLYRLLCDAHRKECAKAVEENRLPPREPVEHRCLVDEVALEPLAMLLQQFPRGLLVCRDELDGWLGSFDSARGGRGAGPSHWLELHGGRQMLIDRRGALRTIRIPRASVSLTGTIQPEILAARLTKSHLANGLFARLLFAYPPARLRRFPTTGVEPAVTQAYEKVVHTLMDLPYTGPREGAEAVPLPVVLETQARQRFIPLVNEFGRDQDDADPALAASFAKLEGYAARLALVLHMARWAAGEKVHPGICDLSTLEWGIALSHWFANEARRVRALVKETPDEADQRKLLGWLHRRGGQATARDLRRSSSRRYSTAEEANAALEELVKAGLGVWVDRPTASDGGRPYRQFVLVEAQTADGGFRQAELAESASASA